MFFFNVLHVDVFTRNDTVSDSESSFRIIEMKSGLDQCLSLRVKLFMCNELKVP